MNRVTAIGRLAADPECSSMSVFEGLAVACTSAPRKGSKILIDGRLEHRT